MDQIDLTERSHLMWGAQTFELDLLCSGLIILLVFQDCWLPLMARCTSVVEFGALCVYFCICSRFLSNLSYCRFVGFCSCLSTEDAGATALHAVLSHMEQQGNYVYKFSLWTIAFHFPPFFHTNLWTNQMIWAFHTPLACGSTAS